MKFIHIADIHADGETVKSERLKKSLSEIQNYLEKDNIDFVIIAGDVWERQQTFNGNSGAMEILNFLDAISRKTKKIFILKGNNHHDNEGSISLLHQYRPNIHAYEHPVMLAVNNSYVEDILQNDYINFVPDYIISLIPYPTKANIALGLTTTNIDNQNAETATLFRNIFDLIGTKAEKRIYTPHILGFHGNVIGAQLSNGQPLIGQELKFHAEILQLAKADYYALGHIHLRQEIAPNMIYSGSIYNCNWGETETKSFELVTVTDKNVTHKPIVFQSARPMQKIEIKPEEIDNVIEVLPEAYLKIVLTVDENEKKLIEGYKKRIEAIYGTEATLQINIMPAQRETRSEEIITAKSVMDEFLAYAKAVAEIVTDKHKEKINLIEHEVMK